MGQVRRSVTRVCDMDGVDRRSTLTMLCYAGKCRQHPEECAEVARRGREMMRFIMQRSHLHEYIVRTLLMLWAQGVDVPYCTGSEACSD